jgi:hypothetical protein
MMSNIRAKRARRSPNHTQRRFAFACARRLLSAPPGTQASAPSANMPRPRLVHAEARVLISRASAARGQIGVSIAQRADPIVKGLLIGAGCRLSRSSSTAAGALAKIELQRAEAQSLPVEITGQTREAAGWWHRFRTHR